MALVAPRVPILRRGSRSSIGRPATLTHDARIADEGDSASFAGAMARLGLDCRHERPESCHSRHCRHGPSRLAPDASGPPVHAGARRGSRSSGGPRSSALVGQLDQPPAVDVHRHPRPSRACSAGRARPACQTCRRGRGGDRGRHERRESRVGCLRRRTGSGADTRRLWCARSRCRDRLGGRRVSTRGLCVPGFDRPGVRPDDHLPRSPDGGRTTAAIGPGDRSAPARGGRTGALRRPSSVWRSRCPHSAAPRPGRHHNAILAGMGTLDLTHG
jgi:hypothetical protein